jgi:hypothetical protein
MIEYMNLNWMKILINKIVFKKELFNYSIHPIKTLY